MDNRFATNEQRTRLFIAFQRVVAILREAKCPEVHLDGSFITSEEHPNDYDMCYEWRGMEPTDELRRLLIGSPDARKETHLGDIFIRMPRPPFFDDYVRLWQTDREDNRKGVILIPLEVSFD